MQKRAQYETSIVANNEMTSQLEEVCLPLRKIEQSLMTLFTQTHTHTVHSLCPRPIIPHTNLGKNIKKIIRTFLSKSCGKSLKDV